MSDIHEAREDLKRLKDEYESISLEKRDLVDLENTLQKSDYDSKRLNLSFNFEAEKIEIEKKVKDYSAKSQIFTEKLLTIEKKIKEDKTIRIELTHIYDYVLPAISEAFNEQDYKKARQILEEEYLTPITIKDNLFANSDNPMVLEANDIVLWTAAVIYEKYLEVYSENIEKHCYQFLKLAKQLKPNKYRDDINHFIRLALMYTSRNILANLEEKLDSAARFDITYVFIKENYEYFDKAEMCEGDEYLALIGIMTDAFNTLTQKYFFEIQDFSKCEYYFQRKEFIKLEDIKTKEFACYDLSELSSSFYSRLLSNKNTDLVFEQISKNKEDVQMLLGIVLTKDVDKEVKDCLIDKIYEMSGERIFFLVLKSFCEKDIGADEDILLRLLEKTVKMKSIVIGDYLDFFNNCKPKFELSNWENNPKIPHLFIKLNRRVFNNTYVLHFGRYCCGTKMEKAYLFYTKRRKARVMRSIDSEINYKLSVKLCHERKRLYINLVSSIVLGIICLVGAILYTISRSNPDTSLTKIGYSLLVALPIFFVPFIVKYNFGQKSLETEIEFYLSLLLPIALVILLFVNKFAHFIPEPLSQFNLLIYNAALILELSLWIQDSETLLFKWQIKAGALCIVVALALYVIIETLVTKAPIITIP